MNTVQYVDLFLSSKKAKGLSTLTIIWYEHILRKFQKYSRKLPKKAEVIETFIYNSPGKDERRHGYFRTLRCFYRFIKRRYRIKNPMVYIDPPKRTNKKPLTLSYQELYKLLLYPHKKRIQASILFLIDTGARLGELYNLKYEDLKTSPWGYIAKIKGKTGERIIPISDDTFNALIGCLPFPYSKHWLGKMISIAFSKAGIKGSAHTLRHTFATLWEGSEFALQSIMGHSKIETLGLYRHLNTETISKQHNIYSPLHIAKGSALQVAMI